MTSRDLCYWLQGFLELSPNLKTLNTEQVNLIRKHLALVFIHEIDPSMGDKEHQKKLDKVHNPELPEQDYKTLEELMKEVEKQKEKDKKQYKPWMLPAYPYYDQIRFNC